MQPLCQRHLSPSLAFFFNLLYSFLSAHRFLSIGLAVKYQGPCLGHGEAASSLSSNYNFITLLFERPKAFCSRKSSLQAVQCMLAPWKCLWAWTDSHNLRWCQAGRHSTRGSWEPPGLQKPSAIGCHFWTWQPLYNSGQYQQAAMLPEGCEG